MKLAITSILFAVLIVSGCGGKSTEPVPTVANASGLWAGTFVPASSLNHTSTISLNLSQGPQSTGSSGLQSAPLNAALTISSSDCPAVVSGKGTGNVTLDGFNVLLNTSDGGTLNISGGIHGNTLLGANYTFLTGTCAPQNGRVSASR